LKRESTVQLKEWKEADDNSQLKIAKLQRQLDELQVVFNLTHVQKVEEAKDLKETVFIDLIKLISQGTISKRSLNVVLQILGAYLPPDVNATQVFGLLKRIDVWTSAVFKLTELTEANDGLNAAFLDIKTIVSTLVWLKSPTGKLMNYQYLQALINVC